MANDIQNFKAELDKNLGDLNTSKALEDLKAEISKKAELENGLCTRSEKAYYSAGMGILSNKEKSYHDLLNKYGLNDIANAKGIDKEGLLNIQNARNEFEKTAKEFKKKVDNAARW